MFANMQTDSVIQNQINPSDLQDTMQQWLEESLNFSINGEPVIIADNSNSNENSGTEIPQVGLTNADQPLHGSTTPFEEMHFPDSLDPDAESMHDHGLYLTDQVSLDNATFDDSKAEIVLNFAPKSVASTSTSAGNEEDLFMEFPDGLHRTDSYISHASYQSAVEEQQTLRCRTDDSWLPDDDDVAAMDTEQDNNRDYEGCIYGGSESCSSFQGFQDGSFKNMSEQSLPVFQNSPQTMNNNKTRLECILRGTPEDSTLVPADQVLLNSKIKETFSYLKRLLRKRKTQQEGVQLTGLATVSRDRGRLSNDNKGEKNKKKKLNENQSFPHRSMSAIPLSTEPISDTNVSDPQQTIFASNSTILSGYSSGVHSLTQTTNPFSSQWIQTQEFPAKPRSRHQSLPDTVPEMTTGLGQETYPSLMITQPGLINHQPGATSSHSTNYGVDTTSPYILQVPDQIYEPVSPFTPDTFFPPEPQHFQTPNTSFVDLQSASLTLPGQATDENGNIVLDFLSHEECNNMTTSTISIRDDFFVTGSRRASSSIPETQTITEVPLVAATASNISFTEELLHCPSTAVGTLPVSCTSTITLNTSPQPSPSFSDKVPSMGRNQTSECSNIKFSPTLCQMFCQSKTDEHSPAISEFQTATSDYENIPNASTSSVVESAMCKASKSNTKNKTHQKTPASLTAQGAKIEYVTQGSPSDLDRATMKSMETNSLLPILKEELKHKILYRRHKEGKGEIDLTPKPPEVVELTVEEEMKRKHSRQLNKIAAKKSRDKKKEGLKNAEMESDRLERANQKLRDKLREGEMEKHYHVDCLVQMGLSAEYIQQKILEGLEYAD